MPKRPKASWVLFAIAALAAAGLILAGGRSFGNRPSALGTAEEAASPENGARPWLVAGPFKSEALSGLEDPLDRDYLSALGLAPSGEASAAPLRIGSGASKLWREARSEADGIDFIAELGPSEYSVAYAYREVASPAAAEAILKIGSDDGVKVWINGNLVLANHVRRALLPDEDAVLVALAKGRNKILVKVSQAAGAWGFSLRLEAPGAGQDRAIASAKPGIVSLSAYPDNLAVPTSGTIRGSVMPKPAIYDGIRGSLARVELLDSSGLIRASTRSRVGGLFSLSLPAGLSGPVGLRVRGEGALSGAASPVSSLLARDPAEYARLGAALARSAEAKAAAVKAGDIPDPAATLEFLARCLEGDVAPALRSFDSAIRALSEIRAIAGKADGREAVPRGLRRYAFTSSVDGSIQPYSLYIPEGYKRSASYGLVMYLHGAGGSDDEAAAALAAATPKDMLILAPYCRGDLAYSGSGENDAIEALDLAEKTYAIDADRVYLSGSSMGGFGTWRLAKLYPWRFAAVVPFAGWTSLEMLENLVSTPLLAVHGDSDTTVPYEPDSAAVEFLKSNGGRASFDLLPNAGHDAFGAWTAEAGPERLFAYLRRFKRDPWPKSIAIRTAMARTGRGAWASILDIALPPQMAALNGRIIDERHITDDTENVSAFELDLRHPGLAKGGRILILADGVNLTADSGKASARFELQSDGRFAAAAPGSRGTMPDGGSGIAALFDSPLRIVYGSMKRSRSADEEGIARAFAQELLQAGINNVEVLSDVDAEKAASPKGRILIGGPEENSGLATLLTKLPLAWKDGRFRSPDGKTEGAGLILVCPDPSDKGRLLGVIDLPMKKAEAAMAVHALVSPMAGGYSQGTCGYGTPDAALLDKSGKPLWIGYFDWRWEKLKTGLSGNN
jgi:pimeloyl-ACP methyl ester carboxylesterase